MKKRHTYAFQPFGLSGSRLCPGYNLSNYEALVITAKLIPKLKFSLVKDQVVVPVHAFMTKPSEEIWLTVEKYKK